MTGASAAWAIMRDWTTLRDDCWSRRALPSQTLSAVQQRLREENLLKVAYVDGVLEFEGRPPYMTYRMGGAISLISFGRVDVDRDAGCIRYQLSFRMLNIYIAFALALMGTIAIAVYLSGKAHSPLAAILLPAIFLSGWLGVRSFAEWRLRSLLRGAIKDAQAEDDCAGR